MSIRLSTNRAINGAIRKGWDAFHAGKTEYQNPYPDLRNDRGMITYSRAFMTSWSDGWRGARDGEPRP